jgi:hypothetical protein
MAGGTAHTEAGILYIKQLLTHFPATAVLAALNLRGQDALTEELVQDGLVGPDLYKFLAWVGQGAPSVDSFLMRMHEGRFQIGLGIRRTGPEDSVGKLTLIGGGPKRRPRLEAIVDHYKVDLGLDVHIPTAWQDFPIPGEYAPDGTPGFVGVDNGKWSYALTYGAVMLDPNQPVKAGVGPGGTELSKLVWLDEPPRNDECAYNMGPLIEKCWRRCHWLFDQGLMHFDGDGQIRID